MKIGFLLFHLTERGTTTALYDYAYYNEKILNNESIIIYNNNHPINFKENEILINKNFKCYTYGDFNEIDTIIKNENIYALYMIKSGIDDGLIVKNCPNLIHSVYADGKHGDKYAFVSLSLTEKYGNKIPYVPHMIDLPKSDKNLRKRLNIPPNAIVFGGYGGKD